MLRASAPMWTENNTDESILFQLYNNEYSVAQNTNRWVLEMYEIENQNKKAYTNFLKDYK